MSYGWSLPKLTIDLIQVTFIMILHIKYNIQELHFQLIECVLNYICQN